MAYGLGDYLIRAVMTADSGLPEDAIINDFAVQHTAGSPSVGELTDAMNDVGDFYRLGATATNRVGSYISNGVDRGATHLLQAYQIVAGPLGSPALELPWLGPVAAVSTNNLPTEVSGVLSFHGDLTGLPEEAAGTRPKSRRRGRIFVGPLILEATEFAEPSPRLHSDFTSALRSNATALFDRLEADGWDWCVWSRTASTLYPITGGWTDNACDTQRRRGTEASSRVTYST